MTNQPGQRDLLPLLYAGSPAEQLGRALAISHWLQTHAEAAGPLFHLLPELREQAAALSTCMRQLQLDVACSVCAAEPRGGCCSAAMAANTDVSLIMLNLVLGVGVRIWPHVQDLCCFLGPDGCLFTAKPVFCLTYYCQRLRNGLAREDMLRLDQHAFRLFTLQHLWEERLMTLIRLHPVPLLPSTP